MLDISIIVAFCNKTFGIGKDGAIPWHVSADLKRFKAITDDSIVVMGRKTFLSLPDDKRPLKNRINIVLTKTPEVYCQSYRDYHSNLMFVKEDDLEAVLSDIAGATNKKVFIIGGSALYARFMGKASVVYATVIDQNYECDTYFPIENFHKYMIEDCTDEQVEDGVKYRFITYKLADPDSVHGEFEYLKNMQYIVNKGNVRDDRTKTGTISVFGPQLRFDISKSLPLLTTKFVGYKSVIKELLFFLKGQTDSKILEAQGVNIWKDNTTREFLDKRGLSHYREGDMGPMYFFVVRHIGAEYKGCDADYTGQGKDQLLGLIDGLLTDPFSRRHMLTTYCPLYNDQGCLLPCHGIVIQFYCERSHETDKLQLSCHVYIRSNDTFLGQPWNIASYAAFTQIIAAKCDMVPKELIISIGDCHIYSNHLDQVKQQLSRAPLPFPILKISDEIKNKSFEEMDIDDFSLVGYIHHPAIKAQMAI